MFIISQPAVYALGGPRDTTERAAPPVRSRSFDPAVVGRLEAAAWVAYYRREWAAFLRLALTLSRGVLRLSWPATVRSGWLVLRAVRLWAPLPDNDPARARRAMARFYRLVGAHSGEPFDPAVAAALELGWWHVPRRSVRRGGATAPSERSPTRCLAAEPLSIGFLVVDGLLRREASLRNRRPCSPPSSPSSSTSASISSPRS